MIVVTRKIQGEYLMRADYILHSDLHNYGLDGLRYSHIV